MDSLQKAIDALNAERESICRNQIYRFDGIGPFDGPKLCKRLGIPVTDDVVIEYPVQATFAPLSLRQLKHFEKRLGGALPDDYRKLLLTFGPFHLPGGAEICFMSPTAVVDHTQGAWQYDLPEREFAVIAVASYGAAGDDLGLLREGQDFARPLCVLKHELRYRDPDPSRWTEKLANSVSDFVVDYLRRYQEERGSK